jgi:hypothetical protein
MVEGAPLSLPKGQIMHTVEEGVFLSPRTRVLGYLLSFVAQYLLDVN